MQLDAPNAKITINAVFSRTGRSILIKNSIGRRRIHISTIMLVPLVTIGVLVSSWNEVPQLRYSQRGLTVEKGSRVDAMSLDVTCDVPRHAQRNTLC